MKKYCILALTIVLTAALFTGCGCTNRNAGATSAPTLMPTTEATRATEATTGMTTEHTTVPTTHETVDNGNGPVENTPNGNGTNDTNGTATEGTVEGRTVPPTTNNKVG